MGRITYDADMNSDPRAENQPTADSGHNVVLVGIDGSDQARHALERALEEARAQDLTVRLLGAYPVIGVGDPGLEMRFTEAVMKENAGHLAEARQTVEQAGLPVEVVEAGGDAAKAVVEQSGEAALVVMGKRGRGGALRGRLGSVSAAVAAHAKCPVIIVPEAAESRSPERHPERRGGSAGDFALEADGPVKADQIDFTGRVVVGLDALGSRSPALGKAVAYAQEHGKALALVSVNGALSGTPSWFQDEFNQARYFHEADQKLTQISDEIAAQHPELTVEHHIFVGRPARILMNATHSADMVVVGSRGIGGFRGLLLGSVSQAVLENATGPVMVVPAHRS
ncbi:universal stress protein [Kocuria rosea]|uniref:Universal stress protein n=2 Tax=Kocuria rosea TaxID=1275 RepID=A0A4R5YSQ9_KOCRO|nr:universal stress protein [Kocuria rosea]